MKKNPLLHPKVSKVIASLGEGDQLVIATADLPISSDVQRIDILLTKGIPTVEQTLSVVLSEMHVQEAIIAEELERTNASLLNGLKEKLGEIPITQVMYVALKQRTKMAKAVIRTGDFTNFATMILIAGKYENDS
ncbi:MAG: D-ribose pyranase [Anaerolineales bacterium]|nr:D-ribose pyranase [Anaerolineales bacterium]